MLFLVPRAVETLLVIYANPSINLLLDIVSLSNSSCPLQVDYEFNTLTNKLEVMHGREHFMSNLSMLLQWSPYSTEADLLKQVIHKIRFFIFYFLFILFFIFPYVMYYVYKIHEILQVWATSHSDLYSQDCT